MKKRYYILMPLMAVSLFSCDKDDNEGNDGTPAVTVPVAIELNELLIEDYNSESLGEGSRVSGSKWSASDKIGVFMLIDGTYNISGESGNKPYVTQSGDGSFTPEGEANTIYLPADGSYMDIVAYYPYRELGEDNTISLDLRDQTDLASLNIMRSTADKLAYNNETPQVGMTFRYTMPQISVTMVAGDGVDVSELTGTKVTLSDMNCSGSYNPVKDELIVGSEKGEITFSLPAESEVARAVVLPEKISAGHTMSITPSYHQGGEPFTHEIPSDLIFRPGKSYDFKITFYRDRISVETTVTDWADGGTESGSVVYDPE